MDNNKLFKEITSQMIVKCKLNFQVLYLLDSLVKEANLKLPVVI